MLTSKVAKRYAKGLLDFTQETQQTSTVFADMKAVVKIMNESKELNRFFQTPFIDYKKKTEVAKQVFQGLAPASQKLIFLVIKHGRENHLKGIAQEFINKVEDLNGVQRVTLTTAAPLSQDNIDKILKASNLVHSQNTPDLKVIIKPELLGGYILRVGDQQLDTSVRSKLIQMKKEFQLN
ncbi:ATP synthase F1 subunit delta [Riemerella columbina]|uniref:ATP synthase F1 subunit delta n=1 Tax=Riemerella columbina TaxID=103810 RepID=UPI00266FC5ED|nr:ATP synthase F1 subunit delta [Riemerella columbina]WKS95868.1 ATP synthase F1 subunit delta [Riemerella columbina]